MPSILNLPMALIALRTQAYKSKQGKSLALTKPLKIGFKTTDYWLQIYYTHFVVSLS